MELHEKMYQCTIQSDYKNIIVPESVSKEFFMSALYLKCGMKTIIILEKFDCRFKYIVSFNEKVLFFNTDDELNQDIDNYFK